MAGAVGTSVLNTVTYLDMAVRGRPASSVPSETAGKLADIAGVPLSGGSNEGEQDGGDPTADNRKEAIGALMGYLTGFGVGAAYGLLRPRLPARVPLAIAGVGIAAAATFDALQRTSRA
jgi:hypothetical protein